jgi:hypothetical protein
MATFNSANGNFQAGNKTLFETMMLASNNGSVISNTNPLPVTLGSNTITITGNVNIGTTVAISNFPVTQNVSFANQTVNISGNLAGITANLTVNNFPVTQNVSFANQTVKILSNTTSYVYTQAAPTWSTDALTKIRVSSTLTQNWFTPLVDDDTVLRWSEASSGSGAGSSFMANTGEIQMTPGNTINSYVYRQTTQKYSIIPGTSHVVYSSVNFSANSTETGVTRRTGLFDTAAGLFWEQTANTIAVVIRRTQANGNIVEDRVYANSFNTDKLDGTGPSGMNIFSSGLNEYYTFWFDFIGGRTGRIRFGIGSPIGPQITHVQSYTGTLNIPFVTEGSLPLRREILNTAAQTTAPVFNMTGVTYQSETVSTVNPSPTTAVNINGYVPAGSLTPLMTIGLRSGSPYNRSSINPSDISIIDTNNQGKNSTPGTFLYEVILNANVNSTYAYNGNGAVNTANIGRASQYWNWANNATMTGGSVLLSGLTDSAAALQSFNSFPGEFNVGSDINGNPFTLTLGIRQLVAGGSAANIVCTWNLTESL